jgi:hypothetical protein
LSWCPAGAEIPLKLEFTNNEGNKWYDTVTLHVYPPSPANVQAAALAESAVRVTWNEVSGAGGYKVYDGSGGLITTINSGSTLSYDHGGRAAGTVYAYRVSALTGPDESSKSQAASAKTWTRLPGFNKSVSGTVVSGLPEYYRFYVLSGVSYVFTSDKTGAVIWESGGTSWFNLGSSTQTQIPSSTGWALIKFDSAGAYTFKVTSGEEAVTGFSFSTSPPSVGTINEAVKTIAVIVPYTTNLTSLTPPVTAASLWACTTAGSQDFTNPVEYRFTKGDLAQVYSVTVALLFPLSLNTWYDNTITAGGVHYYRFSAEAGKTCKIGWNDTQGSGKTGNVRVSAYREEGGETWFTNVDAGYAEPQAKTASLGGAYILKVEGISAGSYAVRTAENTKAISAFEFTSPAATGIINEGAKTIAVTVPPGTNVSNLTPALTHTGVDYSPKGGQNFSGPVQYTITAGDDSAQSYTVTVTVQGQGGITITPPSFGDEVVAGFNTSGYEVSKTGTGAPTEEIILISDTTYSSYEWYVDGVAKPADSGYSGRKLTIRAADYSTGNHTLTIIVYKGAVPWSAESFFAVVP